VSLRIAAAYGREQKQDTVLWRYIRAASDSRDLAVWGSGSRSQDFVHVSDVVTAFELAMDRSVSGVFNIGSGVSITMRELAEAARDATPGSSSAVAFPGISDPQEGRRWQFSIEKARKELGYSPQIGIHDGLKAIAALTKRTPT
jgi:UDP-glucose 4-epimerase